MEGPREPGYYASVTGIRPPGEDSRWTNGPPARGPIALVPEVHRYGPRQARRTYAVRVLLGLGLPDVDVAWRGKPRPVPANVSDPRWQRAMDECMAEAEAEAARLERLDPDAVGR